jgi:hypothetical protein
MRPSPAGTAGQTEGQAALRGDTGAGRNIASISRDDLLADWPRLSRAGDLQVQIGVGRVRVSGHVDSLAERNRIIQRTPPYLPAEMLDIDLSLTPRDPRSLADYLNRLLIERFRFAGPGTRFAVGAELAMDRIAEVMKSYPHIRLGLVGFADPGTPPFARRTIARHRAVAAYQALVRRGVDGRRLVMAHFSAPPNPIAAWYRPIQRQPNGQLQLFSLQGNYPWFTPPSK